MWESDETKDVLTLKTTPLLVWAFGLGAFIFGLYFFNFLLTQIGGFSQLFYIFQKDSKNLVIAAIPIFCFLFGLILFYFAPIMAVKFNRQEQTVSVIKYTLLGKKTRKIGYSYLRSKVQVYSETMDNSEYHKLFFYVENAEKIFLPSKQLWSREDALEFADKVNQYLQPEA